MFSGKPYLSKKNAGITIEVTLSLALSVVVLFLLLGLFSDNIKTLAANSGIWNFFKRDVSYAKTDQNKTFVNLTQTQENVQVVAEQGLDYYIKQAQEIIDKYKKNPPTSLQEEEEAARYITIARIAGTLTNDDRRLFYNSPYNISVMYTQNIQETTAVFKDTKVKLDYTDSRNFASSSDKNKLALIKEVYGKDFTY